MATTGPISLSGQILTHRNQPMKHAHKITAIHDCQTLADHNVLNSHQTIIMSKDQWLGACLDDYLFKLYGTDQVVWLPKDKLKSATFNDRAFEANIACDEMYCCANLIISNTIRMCLVDQHQVKGSQLIPYLMASA